MADWNPWHGCQKISAGCTNCYVYRMDAKYNKDSTIVTKTSSFRLPVIRNRAGDYKIASGEMFWTCFTSDFLIEKADEWRTEAWRMIRERSDCHFLFITKRIDRLAKVLPEDWGNGYENVTIGCTCENQDRADFRLPIFLSLPIRHRFIACEPILEKIDFTAHLSDKIEEVVVGGESGYSARICDYEWVLAIREQCQAKNIPFTFRQTGARLRKDGKVYHIERKLQHSQAGKAGINTVK